MNSKVALVLSYCDTDEKLNILIKNILILKSNNIDVCLISPILLNEDVQLLCDYFIYTKENPILKWPEYGCVHWVNYVDEFDIPFRMNYIDTDYNWTVLYQLKTSFSLINGISYDNVIIMNYDLDMKDNILDYVNGDGNLMFNVKYDNNNTSISPLLLSKWKYTDLKYILSCISKNEWISSNFDWPENYFKHIVHTHNIEFVVPDVSISDMCKYNSVNKKMNNWTDIDNHTYGFKMYITNVYDFNIWLYEFERTLGILEIEIVLKNRNSVKYNICEFKNTMLRTSYRCDEINSICINVDGCILDLTNILTNDVKQIIEYV